MKKFIISLIFVLISTLNINANEVSVKDRNINVATVNIKSDSIHIDKDFMPVYRFLDLKDYQYNEFYRIHKDVYKAIGNLEKDKFNGVDTFNHHMKYDLKNSAIILDRNQYRKYLAVLNTTIQNKGLTNYINK